MCHSTFQRKKTSSNTTSNKSNNSNINLDDSDDKCEYEISEKSEIEQKKYGGFSYSKKEAEVAEAKDITDNTQMPNLPIFSHSSSIKKNYKISTPTTPNSSTNAMPIFFTIPYQMFPFTQNSIPNNIPSLPLRRLVPSLDEFLTKLNESLDNSEEFIEFKNIFENDHITVD
ncbi:hypothetical protein C1645_821373 [Glomus cerebriforme]|uniref:Uncharacterized protein n=1 Tax=Glomus cerebriforme TaxID=658196 RepID=A0A397T6S0_9GLOM|nr:hypothetical protein C1645_821373 [Glomus cerebriforme]